MAYLTRQLLVARVGGMKEYVKLTSDDPDTTPDGTVEELVLGQVDSLLDGYARAGGKATPLSTADASSVLEPLLNIANYKLRSRGNRVASEDDKALWEAAMEIMELIRKGEWIFPSGTEGEEIAAGGGILESEEQMFTVENLKDFG